MGFMSNILIKALVAILTKLITERFLAQTIVYVLNHLAKRTTNNLDDSLVASVAEALGVELKK